MSADFIHSKQGKSAYADCVSPLIHSPRLPSFLPSTGYIKLNDRFVRCCRFPKVCKKNRLTDQPRQSWVHYDNEEGRKEGRERGREAEREGKPVIGRQEETYTVWSFIGNSSFSGKKWRARENPTQEGIVLCGGELVWLLFILPSDESPFISGGPSFEENQHSHYKIRLKKNLLFKCSFRWEPSQYPKCFVFQTLFFH